MSARQNSLKQSTEQTLVIRRVLGAPRGLVFTAWTDPKQMAQWWGPHRFTNPVCELDVRPGGAIRIDMRARVPGRDRWTSSPHTWRRPEAGSHRERSGR